MTPFEKWCNENGYDPKGEFVVTKGISGENAGDLVSLVCDDGTEAPKFNTPTEQRYINIHRLTQHKTEPKMTEQKLPIPRMVEVRSSNDTDWKQRELIADLSAFDVENPYVCRDSMLPESLVNWKQMREIPQPKTRPMTPRELLDAIRGGAVWRYENGNYARWDWNSETVIEKIELCYDWHGTDSDVWVKAEVTE